MSDGRRVNGASAVSVPGGIAEVSVAWLAQVLGPGDLVGTARIGEGFGLNAMTHRVDWQHHEGQVQSVVLKFADAARTQRESTFLDRAPAISSFRIPDFHHANVDAAADRGVIVMEHLAGMEQGDVLAGCSSARAIALARALAELHTLQDSGLRVALDAIEGTRPRFVTDDARVARCVARHGDIFSSRFRESLEDLPRRSVAANDVVLAQPRCIVHDDAHLDNVLFDGGRIVLLDWQGAGLGSPAADLAVLLVNGPLPAALPAVMPLMVAAYVEQRGDAGDDVAQDWDECVRAAIVRLTAGVVNWTGRERADTVGSRKEALGRITLERLDVVQEVLGSM